MAKPWAHIQIHRQRLVRFEEKSVFVTGRGPGDPYWSISSHRSAVCDLALPMTFAFADRGYICIFRSGHVIVPLIHGQLDLS